MGTQEETAGFALGRKAKALMEQGDFPRCLEAAEEALACLASTDGDAVASESLLGARSEALACLAAASLRTGDLARARVAGEEALAVAKEIPDGELRLRRIHTVCTVLGQVLLTHKQHEQLLHLMMDTALPNARRLRTLASSDGRLLLAVTIQNTCALLEGMGRADTALDLAQEALELFDVTPEGPELLVYAHCLNTYATMLDDLGRTSEALSIRPRQLETTAALAADNSQKHRELHAGTLWNYAIELHRAKRTPEAIAVCKTSLRSFAALADEDDWYLSRTSDVGTTLAQLQRSSGQLDEALDSATSSIEVLRRLDARDGSIWSAELCKALCAVEWILLELHQPDRAREIRIECIGLLRALAWTEWGAWSHELGNVAESMCEHDEESADFFEEFLALFVARMDFIRRDSHIGEVHALSRFCHCYLTWLRKTLAPKHPDYERVIWDVVAAVHSRDLHQFLLDHGDGRPARDPRHETLWRRGVERDELAAALKSIRRDLPAAQEMRETLRRLEAALESDRKLLREPSPPRFASGHGFTLKQDVRRRLTDPANGTDVGALVFLELAAGNGVAEFLALVAGPDVRAFLVPLPQDSFVATRTAAMDGRAFRDVLATVQDEEGIVPPPAQRALARLALNSTTSVLGPTLVAALGPSCPRKWFVCLHGSMTADMIPPTAPMDDGTLLQFVIYPGLPHWLATPAVQQPVGHWMISADAALETTHPIPFAGLEASLAREFLRRQGLNADFGEFSSGRDRGGWLAICHGRQDGTTIGLQLGGNWIAPSLMLASDTQIQACILSACFAGLSPRDRRGNSMGLPAALILRGTAVVVGYVRPVLDRLAPWITLAILWSVANGATIREATHNARELLVDRTWPTPFRHDIAHLLTTICTEADGMTWLRRCAESWPWEGMSPLVFSETETSIPERLAAVVTGLFEPAEIWRGRYEEDALLAAFSLVCFGE